MDETFDGRKIINAIAHTAQEHCGQRPDNFYAGVHRVEVYVELEDGERRRITNTQSGVRTLTNARGDTITRPILVLYAGELAQDEEDEHEGA